MNECFTIKQIIATIATEGSAIFGNLRDLTMIPGAQRLEKCLGGSEKAVSLLVETGF